MIPLFVQISNMRTPPPLILGGRKLYQGLLCFQTILPDVASQTYGPMAVSLVVKKYNWGNSKKPLKPRKNLKVFHACLR